MVKDKIEFDNFLLTFKVSQGHLMEFITKRSKLLKSINRHDSTFQLFWVIMRSFREYNVAVPLVSSGLIGLYESQWNQRMRSNRELSQEALMTLIKTEIKQLFMVDFVMNNLQTEDSKFEIKDNDLLLKTYSSFFALIELMDDEIGKVIGV